MSVDYYLYSPSTGRRAMIGSIGLSGIQSFPGEQEVVELIRATIDGSLNGETIDIKLVIVNQFEAEDDKNGRGTD